MADQSLLFPDQSPLFRVASTSNPKDWWYRPAPRPRFSHSPRPECAKIADRTSCRAAALKGSLGYTTGSGAGRDACGTQVCSKPVGVWCVVQACGAFCSHAEPTRPRQAVARATG